MFKALLSALLYFISCFSYAQEVSFTQKVNDTINLEYDPLVIIDSLQSRGYLEAKFTINSDGPITYYQYFKGEIYTWGNIVVKKDGKLTSLKIVNAEIYRSADKMKLRKKLNEYLSNEAHNKGYPFAEASLLIDSIGNQQIYATINLDFKNEITYDSIIIQSEGNVINKAYLQRFLNIPIGDIFSTEVYVAIPEKLKKLPFLRLVEPPTIAFSNNQSQITLVLEDNATSQLDAFIGFIPEQERTNITGQVDVSFQNLFKRAINWQLNWQKYSANSQFLDTRLSQFAAFKTPLGFQTQFGLLQEDSTFLQNEYEISVFYPFKNALTLGIGYKGLLNNIIREFDSTEVNTQEEPFRSSQINAVSLLVGWRQFITYPVLQNDHFFLANFDIGVKKIRNFNSLPEIWKDVPERSINYTARINLGAQQKIFKRFLVEQRLEVSVIENNALSRNDLLRLGGLQNLRGFDRNFFYTSYYGLLSLNYRYFLDNNSSFFLLTDFATLEKKLGNVYTFGAGLDLRTKNGWFRLIYAVGTRENENVNFSTAKVHFGYIALF